MRSLELSLDKYDSDKIRDFNYLEYYDPIFDHTFKKRLLFSNSVFVKGVRSYYGGTIFHSELSLE
jgi:hypothetical protein